MMSTYNKQTITKQQKIKKQVIASILLIVFLCSIFVTPIYAASTESTQSTMYRTVTLAIEDVANVLLQDTTPKPGSIGGEWLILGLARSNVALPDPFVKSYTSALESLLKEKNGVLHKYKYTEYSRTVLALTALGKNPSDIAGYNLLTPLGDYNATIQQGINGAIFALLALDSGNYTMPLCQSATTKATRQLYVNFILSKELSGGGWAMQGNTADVDITAMALQALAPYRDAVCANAEQIDVQKVEAAVMRGVDTLSKLQDPQGGFTSYGVSSCESTAQVIVALTTLGIDLQDVRFVKNQYNTLDHLMTFYQKGKGFLHVANGTVNAMATEQAFYALVAVERQLNGKHTLYDMTPEKMTEIDLNAAQINSAQKTTIVQRLQTYVDGIWRKAA